MVLGAYQRHRAKLGGVKTVWTSADTLPGVEILQYKKHEPNDCKLCKVEPITKVSWLADENTGIEIMCSNKVESKGELLCGRYGIEQYVSERDIGA